MKVVSGGQTGVDRAALEAASGLGFPVGGWVPRGGWAEDRTDPPGILADYPSLRPTPSAKPAERTEWNVRDSDRTLILVTAAGLAASPGTAVTAAFAGRYGRPCLVVDIDAADAAARVADWLAEASPDDVLNVAGPRESEAPGIEASAAVLLKAALSALR
ncbi:MAG: hypothetical protein KDJ88_03435 [Bauldia sp.]|nr:hypothetical protein [Bauldia sp.]